MSLRLVTFSLLVVLASPILAAPLTADDAVRIALQRSGAVVQSESQRLSARSGLWSAYARLTPSVSAEWSRGGAFTDRSTGNQVFGAVTVLPSSSFDSERYQSSYGLSGRWAVLDPSALAGLSSARQGMRAADLGQRATRADVRLETKRRFYSVVKAMHLARVSSQALRIARDDERRVRALFEVGSVSKSDLL
ncbi:MAG: TolC family protein, partial [bacterium]